MTSRLYIMSQANRLAFLSLLVFIVIHLNGAHAPAQVSQTISPTEKLNIRGVDFGLGMSEAEVTQKLKEGSFGVSYAQLSSPGSKSVFLCESPNDTECDPTLGQIGFVNGRVTVVVKRWAETKVASEIVAAFYAAVKDFDKGISDCKLSAYESLSPRAEIKNVNATCNGHFRISVSDMHSAKTASIVTVDQELVARTQ